MIEKYDKYDDNERNDSCAGCVCENVDCKGTEGRDRGVCVSGQGRLHGFARTGASSSATTAGR